MFPDHPVRKLAYLDSKKYFTKSPYGGFFLKGLTNDSGQKLEFFSLLAFKQNGP